jgi:hypothetical protein
MTTPNTIRQVLIEIYGEEFPEIKTMSGDDFQNRFGVSPVGQPKYVRLDQTYKMAEYLNEDHFNVIDGIFSTAGLHRKRDLKN